MFLAGENPAEISISADDHGESDHNRRAFNQSTLQWPTPPNIRSEAFQQYLGPDSQDPTVRASEAHLYQDSLWSNSCGASAQVPSAENAWETWNCWVSSRLATTVPTHSEDTDARSSEWILGHAPLDGEIDREHLSNDMMLDFPLL
jgi:hypothetical protein